MSGSGSSGREIRSRLVALQKKPENGICCDCLAPKPAFCLFTPVNDDTTTDTDIRIGAFVCALCAIVHRNVKKETGGTVKNVSTDEWSDADVVIVERHGGNKIFNSVWEGKIAFDTPRPPTAIKADEFIYRKYIEKLYFQPTALKLVKQQQTTTNNGSNGGSSSINFLKGSASKSDTKNNNSRPSRRRASMTTSSSSGGTPAAMMTTLTSVGSGSSSHDPFGGSTGSFGGEDGFFDAAAEFGGDFGEFGGDGDDNGGDTWWEPTASGSNDPFGDNNNSFAAFGVGGGGISSPKPTSKSSLSSSKGRGQTSGRHAPSRSKSSQDRHHHPRSGGGFSSRRKDASSSLSSSHHSKDSIDSIEGPQQQQQQHRPAGGRRVRRGSLGYSQPAGEVSPHPPLRKQGDLLLGSGGSNHGDTNTDDGQSVASSSSRRRVGRRGSVGGSATSSRKLLPSGSNHSTSLDSIDDTEENDFASEDGPDSSDRHHNRHAPRRRQGRRGSIGARAAPGRSKSADDILELNNDDEAGAEGLGYGDGAPDQKSDHHQRPVRRRTGRRGSVGGGTGTSSRDLRQGHHKDDANGDDSGDGDRHTMSSSRRNLGERSHAQRTRSGLSCRQRMVSRELATQTSSRKLSADNDTATTECSDSSDHSRGNNAAAPSKPRSTKLLASLYGGGGSNDAA